MIKGKFNEMCKDIRCKQNMIRPIDRKVCRNNCKYWNYNLKECLLGYNNKK